MSKIIKKGKKLLETIKNTVPMEKIQGLEDFYLMKQGTQFAIREVEAYYINNTDMVLVLGGLDLASRTAKQAAEKRKARKESMLSKLEASPYEEEYASNTPGDEETDAVEDIVEDKAHSEPSADLSITEDDIKVVMEQGGVPSREEAVKLLKEHGGDPLAILMALGK